MFCAKPRSRSHCDGYKCEQSLFSSLIRPCFLRFMKPKSGSLTTPSLGYIRLGFRRHCLCGNNRARETMQAPQDLAAQDVAGELLGKLRGGTANRPRFPGVDFGPASRREVVTDRAMEACIIRSLHE